MQETTIASLLGQHPSELRRWIEHLLRGEGECLTGLDWAFLAEMMASRAKSGDATSDLEWGTLALLIYENLKQLRGRAMDESEERAAMNLRVSFIERLGPEYDDPLRDPRIIIAWFRRVVPNSMHETVKYHPQSGWLHEGPPEGAFRPCTDVPPRPPLLASTKRPDASAPPREDTHATRAASLTRARVPRTRARRDGRARSSHTARGGGFPMGVSLADQCRDMMARRQEGLARNKQFLSSMRELRRIKYAISVLKPLAEISDIRLDDDIKGWLEAWIRLP